MPAANSLLIDRAAAAERPTPDALRAWAADQRVFISSVMVDFAAERAIVAKAIRDFGARPVWFEEFGGRDDDPQAAYLSEVVSSTIYVGLLGARYGTPGKDRFSATHAEYRRAEEAGLRISVWVARTADLEGAQQSFLDEVRQFHVTGSWEHPSDLADRVVVRLTDIAAEDLTPWVKVGHVLLRARRVHDAGGKVSVEARVRDDDALQRLAGLRTGGWFGPEEVRFSIDRGSWPARVTDVAVSTSSTRVHDVTLQLQLQSDDQGGAGFTDMTFHGGGRTYGPDDRAEIAVRGALFGEENPLGISAGLARMPDPLEPLRARPVSSEALAPIARVLLTEAIVASGHGSRITRFRLGTLVAGFRAIDVEWAGVVRYAGTEPSRRRVIGRVALP